MEMKQFSGPTCPVSVSGSGEPVQFFQQPVRLVGTAHGDADAVLEAGLLIVTNEDAALFERKF